MTYANFPLLQAHFQDGHYCCNTKAFLAVISCEGALLGQEKEGLSQFSMKRIKLNFWWFKVGFFGMTSTSLLASSHRICIVA